MDSYLFLFYFMFVLGFIEAQKKHGLTPIKDIPKGQLRGGISKTIGLGKTYYYFQGIPYAEPPTGELRFEPPVPKKNWDGILDATKDRSECVQIRNSKLAGDEDCLFLNVYTPTLQNDNLPVMVYIHGGGFLNGNSSYTESGPDYLLDENVVFVSMNYRMGIFGFISTKDLVAPGNNGLKDQNLALKWVQRNIKYFGGNPGNVTLFGQSAGSASVSYHIQSKMSKGLFSRAILESGSSLCLWSLDRRSKRIAFETGKQLHVETHNSSSLISGLRKINSTDLVNVSMKVGTKIFLEDPLAGIMFSPVIEPYHDSAFFYNYSHTLLEKGEFNRVPIMMGVTSKEATINAIPDMIRPFFYLYSLNIPLLAPADLAKDLIRRTAAGSEISFHYSGLKPLAADINAVSQFVSDDQFNRPVRENVKLHSKYAPVYYYVFSYEGRLGGKVNRTTEGVGHAEDLGYIFRMANRESNNPFDGVIRKKTVTLWTNFAKFGSPTPVKDPILDNVTWTVSNINADELSYLRIGAKMEIGQNPFQKNMEFYDQIYKKFGTPPYDTY